VVRCLRIFYPEVDPKPLIASIEVPTLTLPDLLKKYHWDAIDLLQVDAEGLDYEILKMVDFKQVRPAIVHFEYFHLSNADREAAARMLVDNGYRLYFYHMNVLAYRGELLA
jgi:Methyltransferase FkbM domain